MDTLQKILIVSEDLNYISNLYNILTYNLTVEVKFSNCSYYSVKEKINIYDIIILDYSFAVSKYKNEHFYKILKNENSELKLFFVKEFFNNNSFKNPLIDGKIPLFGKGNKSTTALINEVNYRLNKNLV